MFVYSSYHLNISFPSSGSHFNKLKRVLETPKNSFVSTVTLWITLNKTNPGKNKTNNFTTQIKLPKKILANTSERVTKPFQRLTQTACKRKAVWKRKVISDRLRSLNIKSLIMAVITRRFGCITLLHCTRKPCLRCMFIVAPYMQFSVSIKLKLIVRSVEQFLAG